MLPRLPVLCAARCIHSATYNPGHGRPVWIVPRVDRQRLARRALHSINADGIDHRLGGLPKWKRAAWYGHPLRAQWPVEPGALLRRQTDVPGRRFR